MITINEAYRIAEHLHLAYGFPLMLREIGHWLWKHYLRAYWLTLWRTRIRF